MMNLKLYSHHKSFWEKNYDFLKKFGYLFPIAIKFELEGLVDAFLVTELSRSFLGCYLEVGLSSTYN